MLYKLARVGTLCHLLLYGCTPLSILSLSITSFVSVYWLTALKEIAGVAAPPLTVYYAVDNVYPKSSVVCFYLDGPDLT